jgi:hypothetical protein
MIFQRRRKLTRRNRRPSGRLDKGDGHDGAIRLW